MPATTSETPEPRISARIGESLKKRLIKAAATTGQDESEIVRAALVEFFTGKNPNQIIAAVIRAKSKSA